MAINYQRPAGFTFKSGQIWENFYNTSATTRSIGPRSTKPKNFKTKNGCTCPHVKPRSLNNLRPSPSNLCKSAHNFRKPTIPWSSTALDRQNPKNSRPKKLSCVCGDTDVHSLSFMCHLTKSLADTRHAPCLAMCHAPYSNTRLYFMTSWMTAAYSVWLT